MSLDGCKIQTNVKHLLIDEMQDYSPIQYKVIRKLYPCHKTILGDAGQPVNPYGSSDAEMIQKAFVTGEIMKLNKSYRSTYEITVFSRIIRPGNEAEIIERHGEYPQVYQYKRTEDELIAITGFITRFRKSGFKSLGIICKEEHQAFVLYKNLQQSIKGIHFLSQQSTAYINGIIISFAQMSKGLEFDEVIVPHADRKNYKTETDRSILYIAVTRAMHRLSVTCSGEITGFLIR